MRPPVTFDVNDFYVIKLTPFSVLLGFGQKVMIRDGRSPEVSLVIYIGSRY